MASKLLINEFMFNPSVSGDPDEFIEVKGDASTDYSEWSIIVVDGDGTAAGKIDNVFQVGTTSSDGYWATPFLTNTLQNGTQTVLLVKDFTGKVGDNVDTTKSGTFTSTPWSEIEDTIAVSDGGKGDPTYADAPVLTGARAAGASRIPDGTDTDSTSDWVADDPSLAGIDGYGTTAAAGSVLVTPGAANNGTNSGGSDTDDNSGSDGSDTGGGNSGSSGNDGTGNTSPQQLTVQQINGTGYFSTYANSSVMTTGVVTAVDTNGSIGFWIQESTKDKDTVGSSAIFVYAGKDAALPTVGTTVSVTGTVTNYSGTSWEKSLTLPEINLVSYTDTGASYTQVAPTLIGQGGETVPASSYLGDLAQAINLNQSTATLSPDTNALDFYRNLLGQLVTLNNVVAVSASSGNAVWVVPDNGNGLLTPTGALQSTETSINTQRVELYYDSGVTPGTAPSVELGDSLGSVTGILTYYNGIYELVPTTQVTVIHTEQEKPVTSFHKDDQNLLISDYNIENFNALDPANADRLKQVAQIIVKNLDNPDILALQEIQDDSGTTNDGTVSAEQNLAALVQAIAAAGGPTYSWAQVDPANNTQGGVSGGNIRSVYLYNADRVTLKAPVTTIGNEELNGTFKNTRLPLVGTFEFNGKDVTLLNVHLSSQAGSSELYGSTQPPVNHGGTTATVNNRIAQAEYITDYVNSLRQQDPDAKIGILGDFNDTEWSDANTVYTNGGLTDMSSKEDASNRYTYIFEGNAQSLDHTIGTSAFADAGQFETVHVNTGYLDAESDHDPSVTLLEMSDYSASSGETLTNTVVANGQTAVVKTGASAADISVADGGRLALYSGSSASNIQLSSGAQIDLPELAWSDNATLSLTDPSTLKVSNGTDTYSIALDGNYDAAFFSLAADGSGGTELLTEGTPCYCRGTLIETDHGPVSVEFLKIGDLVKTLQNGFRPIKWIGRRSYSGRFAAGNKEILPVVFRQGSLGNGLPTQDLSVSPLHAMYLAHKLVPAMTLVNGMSIIQAEAMDEVAYFHIELESHDVIFAHGAPSETFVDDDSRGMFLNASEFQVLYPQDQKVPAQYCAPRLEEGVELEQLRTDLLRLTGMHTLKSVGTLSGYIDTVSHTIVQGWARDSASEEPVRLSILNNGVTIGEIIANQPRADVGSSCGFRFEIPGGLSPFERHVIEVQRMEDSAPLKNSPWMLDLNEEPQAPLYTTQPNINLESFEGYLDAVSREQIRGWAWNPATPDTPVAIQILDNGKLIATTVANGLRPDVELSGRALRCGFDVILPVGLSPFSRHVIEVRRASDGMLLSHPHVLEPVDAFDPAFAQSVSRAVKAVSKEHRKDVLSFLLAQVEQLTQEHAQETSGKKQTALHSAHARRGLKEARPAKTCRALVIDTQRPNKGRDAGSHAILSHITALQDLGYDVSFVAADQMEGPDHLDNTPDVTVLTAPFYRSVEDVLSRQNNSFDIVYLHREEIASRYMGLTRRHQPRARIIYSVADLHFLRTLRQAQIEARPELIVDSRRLKLREYQAACQADIVLTHSPAEAALLKDALPLLNTAVIPWSVPLKVHENSFERRKNVLFLGNYAHAPNVDAARWLVEEIMPLVWLKDPSIKCLIAGTNMPARVRSLQKEGVDILGEVSDLDALFSTLRLSIAPLRFGAGIKGKVLESLSYGVPCVMTPIAAEGLPLTAGLHENQGETAQELAEQILQLHNSQPHWCRASIEGRHLIRMTYNQEQITSLLKDAIKSEARKAG